MRIRTKTSFGGEVWIDATDLLNYLEAERESMLKLGSVGSAFGIATVDAIIKNIELVQRG